MDKLTQFVLKNRVIKDLNTFEKPRNITVETKPQFIPWFKRPLAFEEFICKEGRDNNYYVRHKEWGKRIWIGPYSSKKDAEKIIKAYVAESIKAPLDTKVNNKVHSIIIENAEKFFL